MTAEQLPPIDHVHTLAGDLIRALTERPGDDNAVCEVLTHWHDQLGYRDLGFVCMAALRSVFGECLTPHPDSVPIGALTIDTTKAGVTP